MAIRLCFAFILCAGLWAKPPKADASFQAKLAKNLRIDHALDRLTFGQRPGDSDAVRRLGIKKWVELQLHPERMAENPELERRLAPLETLRITPLEIWERYPQQQNILAVLTGKPALPDDPILRVTVQRYAAFLKLPAENPDTKPSFASLEPVAKLEDYLSSKQINVLKNGKPDEKRAVLASIPDEKLDEFL